jgi:hypothetical protein
LELEKIAHQFAKQAYRLLLTFEATNHTETGSCCSKSHQPTRSDCVINLHNQWFNFCRTLVIKSSEGGATTRSGILLSRSTVLPIGIDTIVELRRLSGSRLPPFWEPHWADASGIIAACRTLNTPNFSNITAAIGVTNSPAEAIRVSRNYLSHKNLGTANKVVTELIGHGARLPLDLDALLLQVVSPNTTLFKSWVDDLSMMAFNACG